MSGQDSPLHGWHDWRPDVCFPFSVNRPCTTLRPSGVYINWRVQSVEAITKSYRLDIQGLAITISRQINSCNPYTHQSQSSRKQGITSIKRAQTWVNIVSLVSCYLRSSDAQFATCYLLSTVLVFPGRGNGDAAKQRKYFPQFLRTKVSIQQEATHESLAPTQTNKSSQRTQ